MSRSSFTSAIDPSGSTIPPCDVPDCTLILETPAIPRRPRAVEAVHVGAQLAHRAVLRAHLADLATHRNGHARRLGAPHHLQDVDAHFVVQPLLLVERRLGDVDQRGRVDVDVVEPGVDGLTRELLHAAHLARRVVRELLGVHLEVVALDEQRTAEPFAQRGGEHHRHVLGRAADRCTRSPSARSRG